MRRIIYHPEAIALKVEPNSALDHVRDAVLRTTRDTGAGSEVPTQQRWIPHITLAYSTSVQPANPIIAALGHQIPMREISVSSIHLITQKGAERLWDWHTLAHAPFEGRRPTAN